MSSAFPIALLALLSDCLQHTLYKHFPSKEAIYSELEELLCQGKIQVSETIRNLEPSTSTLVYAMFQGKFAIITPALIAGAFAERVNFKAYVFFIAVWGIIVYNPLCHWVWAEDGFLFNLGANGAIDFAGGTVVHISAGVSGLVAAIYLGARKGFPKTFH